MPTPKKKTPAKKSTAKAAPTKSAKAAKSSKTSSARKSTSKPAAKVSTVKTNVPQGREHELAERALKMLDEATGILRNGIRQSASTTAKSRIAATKKANTLIGKATNDLSKVIEAGGSGLQKLLKKAGGG